MRRIPIAIAIAVTMLVLLGATASAQGDITPPVLVEITIEPLNVDTSNGPQVITVTVRFTDDLSGFRSALINFRPVTAPQSQTPLFSGSDLIDGDEHDGFYRQAFVLPQFAAEGQWYARQLTLSDRADNSQTFFSSQPTGEFLKEFQFFNGPPPFDSVLFLPSLSRTQ